MVSSKIKQIMRMKKVTNIQLAKHLGTSPQALANKFSRDSLSAEEMISILVFLENIFGEVDDLPEREEQAERPTNDNAICCLCIDFVD